MARRFLPFRVPKGVPSEIRRVLRLGKPGRFLSTVKALQLADLLELAGAFLSREHERASRAAQRAPTPRQRAKLLEVEQEDARRRAALAQVEEEAGVQPLPPIASRDVVPVVPDAEEEGDDYAQAEEGAAEIEIGIDYVEADGWTHRKGPTSDVSFNARLFRRDRRPMTESDARSAMDYFAGTGTMPRGIDVRTVSWRDARGRVTKGGTEDDLANFQNILRHVGDEGLRVGLVKPEGL